MKTNKISSSLLMELEMKFDIELPEEIQKIYNAFLSNGRKLYVVGGAVRDALLGKVPKDFDLVTDAKPEEVIKILNDSGIKSIPKGVQFGVVSAIINGEEFEIATFRTEDYGDNSDGRRPTSVQFSDIEGDVSRRDLSMNALYYDINKRSIIDLVGGVDDIKNKRVKTVGNPEDRFQEDRLRTLRAIRFSNRFGSELDEPTKKSILKFKDLPGVSNERIRDEFLKGLQSSISPEKFLKDYESFDLYKRMFGNLVINKNYIQNLKDPILVLSNLLFNNKIEYVITSLNNFKATNLEVTGIKFLLNFYNKFKDFDKLTFIPEIDGKWLLNLKNDFNKSVINDEQLLLWSKLRGINENLTKKFIDFVPTITAKDFPHIQQGQELGKAISTANAELFINSL